MKKFIPIILMSLVSILSHAKDNPKLVVYLVFDQMRADYLLKFKSEFKKTKINDLGGFLYLMDKGAYYPYAEYDVLQNMTCPGHAMISTGSWPINTGIAINDWYAKDIGKSIYCVEDEKDGYSPRRLATTTVSDEFKSLDKPSKVYGVALKDRSAIMLAGHRADGAIWFNDKTWSWESSSYYKELPAWVKNHNNNLNPKTPDKSLLMKKWGVEATVNLALDLIKKEKLGQTSGTDFLFLSFSTHDIAGHTYGPNATEMKNLTLEEDREVSRLLNFLNKNFNIHEEVQFVLTADHGIPSSIEYSVANKIPAEFINEIQLVEKLYSFLNKKYGSTEKRDWFKAMKPFHYFVNFKIVDDLKINRNDFLETVREFLISQNQLEDVLISSKLHQALPVNPQIRSQVQNSFVASQWGDLVLIPKPYFMNQTSSLKVNHITGYSYDRTVPLILMGKKFKPNTYYQKAYIVDIAPTVAATLGSLPGAKSDGRILHEALKTNSKP